MNKPTPGPWQPAYGGGWEYDAERVHVRTTDDGVCLSRSVRGGEVEVHVRTADLMAALDVLAHDSDADALEAAVSVVWRSALREVSDG